MKMTPTQQNEKKNCLCGNTGTAEIFFLENGGNTVFQCDCVWYAGCHAYFISFTIDFRFFEVFTLVFTYFKLTRWRK